MAGDTSVEGVDSFIRDYLFYTEIFIRGKYKRICVKNIREILNEKTCFINYIFMDNDTGGVGAASVPVGAEDGWEKNLTTGGDYSAIGFDFPIYYGQGFGMAD